MGIYHLFTQIRNQPLAVVSRRLAVVLVNMVACSPVEYESGDVFEMYWTEMDRKYVYFDEKGVDWNAIYTTYYPQTRNASTEEYLRVFQEIIDTLKDGHVFLETPDTMLFYRIPISGIDNFWFGGAISKYLPISAKKDTSVDNCYDIFQLNNEIVYIRLYSFYSHFRPQNFQWLMNHYSYTKGITIDVRHNAGGYENNVAEWASCFFTGQKTIYYERHKIGHGHNDFTGYIPTQVTGRGIIDQNLPVVVLAGGHTYSAANIFVGVIKHLPDVTVIGRCTGGGGSPRSTAILPNGWKYTYSQSPKYDILYNSLEAGVTPHYEITLSPEDLEEIHQTSIDKTMETAYQYLLNQ